MTYSQVIGKVEELQRRIPPKYVSGRVWDPIRGRRVLNLGCGSVESEQFKEIASMAEHVDGVDSDPLSGARYTSLSEVPAGEHNGLVAEHVLEHMTHDQVVASFTEASRILPAGSVVIVTVPNITNFGGWFNNFDHKNFSPPINTAAIIELHGFFVAEMFGWSKPSRFERHANMTPEEQGLCAFVEEQWGLTLPQYVTIGAIKA